MTLSLLERSVELKLWLSPDYEPIFRGLAMKALGDNVRKARTGDVSEDRGAAIQIHFIKHDHGHTSRSFAIVPA